MRLAILSDIHGNSHALRACLTRAESIGCTHLLILGDLIGYYYDAQGVLDLIAAWPKTVISGNHERCLYSVRHSQAAAAAYRQKYGSALDIATNLLSEDDLDWLCTLPERATYDAGAAVIELCHGSPRNCDEYVYPNASADVLAACALPNRKLVLMGHTHYPFKRQIGATLLVNPGSVGQARNCGGMAFWAVFDTMRGTVAMNATPYDVAPLVEEVGAKDPQLPYLAYVLTRNHTPANEGSHRDI